MPLLPAKERKGATNPPSSAATDHAATENISTECLAQADAVR